MTTAAHESTLLKVIEERKRLLKTLKRNGPKVNWNEHQTRYTFLDPVLGALGWDVSDPRQVRIEASNSSGDRPDYLLYDSQGNLQVVVEAKKVTTGDIRETLVQEGVAAEDLDWMEWSEREESQLTKYWKNDRPCFAALSSGVFWAIYGLPNARGKLENKRINYFNILSQPPTDYMADIMKLHRCNVGKLE